MPNADTQPELRVVHDALASALAGRSDLYVRWGPELARDPSAAAAALRAAGASWDWVALGFSARSFWDLHVGILPVESGYSVGLHWTSAVDQDVHPWAPIAVPRGELRYATVAGEYQLLCTDANGVAVHSTQSTADAALEIAARVLPRIGA
ncbi:hypothetical protein SAMN05444365_109161 [Micromonospora pattaloongensis]|uniref:Uncharacterized protein n=1 Tax=Micromonospora pattaloongensis TaxID=405436 RepID=A0A1H3RZW2_9ACTN|nr:hypothetical protein [Micromonospora pattaloongensis]SDZ30439.1 hypothetical protein SAMN05444365_109161 [Micromonospora pattaloongensis]